MRILVIGAHPDDCDIKAGGTAVLWRRSGHAVRFVSMTNGNAGHHRERGESLARRRKAEAQAAAAVLDVEYLVLDHDDGQLEVSLQNRLEVVRLIRAYAPDLVLTHRPFDYHPDHRYTSQLVLDAAYMVTVPAIAPETPFLERNPTFGYLFDPFVRPYPFAPTVAVPIDDVVSLVVEALDRHASQFYEWLPFNRGESQMVPDSPAGRKEFLRQWYCRRISGLEDGCRDLLIAQYGVDAAAAVRFVEAFEISEYGAPLAIERRRALFHWEQGDADITASSAGDNGGPGGSGGGSSSSGRRR